MQQSAKTQTKELVITRTFNAPRELVWKAWTEPEQAKQWWGPKAFTAPFAKIDLRVGGKYLLAMRSPEGQDFWSTGTYEEIAPQERLVMTDSFADETGNIVPASHYGMSPDWPLELTVTVTFEKAGNNTRMTLKHSGIKNISDTDYSNMKQGWEESFDKLAAYLTKAA